LCKRVIISPYETKIQDYTEEEKQVIEQQRQNELLNPTTIAEPIDVEKVAMAEAIIDLEARLSVLENK